jgi:hypothetical protein
MNADHFTLSAFISVYLRLSLSVRPLLSPQAFVRMYIILKFARQIRKEAGKNLSRICNKGWVRGVVLAACSLDGRGRDLGVLSQRREGEDGEGECGSVLRTVKLRIPTG